MNTFKIGTNFDLALLDKIVELNKTYPNSLINEVYGSTREMAFVAARPDFRLPDVDKKMLEDKHFKILLYEALSNNVFSGTDIKGGIVISYHDINGIVSTPIPG